MAPNEKILEMLYSALRRYQLGGFAKHPLCIGSLPADLSGVYVEVEKELQRLASSARA